MFLSDNYEVQCLGFEIGQIILSHPGNHDFKDQHILIQGLITVSTVLEFMQNLFRNYTVHDRQEIINKSFQGEWFEEQIVQNVYDEVDEFFSHSNRERKITLEILAC